MGWCGVGSWFPSAAPAGSYGREGDVTLRPSTTVQEYYQLVCLVAVYRGDATHFMDLLRFDLYLIISRIVFFPGGLCVHIFVYLLFNKLNDCQHCRMLPRFPPFFIFDV